MPDRPQSLFLRAEVKNVVSALSQLRLTSEAEEFGLPNDFDGQLDTAGDLLRSTYSSAASVVRTDVSWAVWVYGELVHLEELVAPDDARAMLAHRWRSHLDAAFGTLSITG